jgi:hypothetical protein
MAVDSHSTRRSISRRTPKLSVSGYSWSAATLVMCSPTPVDLPIGGHLDQSRMPQH